MPDTTNNWHITAQAPMPQAANGQIQDGYKIHFVTGQGHPGEVWVPQRDYTPDKVRAAITAQAENIDAVGSLTGNDGSQ